MTDASFPITERTRLRRRHERGRFDKATVYDILDAAMVCHIAYTIDGQPFCTPTGFWRENDKLYWHGSSASRMIRSQSDGVPVCVTVTHLDAIVLARSGFHHSVNYRSVMAFGTARLVTDEAEKLAALDGFVDRFFPGRSKEIRPANKQEIDNEANVPDGGPGGGLRHRVRPRGHESLLQGVCAARRRV